jgi:Leucine-rich repeat (LRR) protein
MVHIIILSSNRVPEFKDHTIAVLTHSKHKQAYTKVKALSLYGNSLTSISGISVFDSSPLEILNVGCNDITSLPSELASLKSLTSLSAEANKLTAFPEEAIATLPNLKSLRLSINNIMEIPVSIGSFAFHMSLKELYLDRCGLIALPHSIGQLVNLETLNCSGNHIEIVPDSIGSLTSLKLLSLSSNQIAVLPGSLSLLVQLHHLYLNRNQIQSVPSEYANMTQLQTVNLSHNCITEFEGDVKQAWSAAKVTLESNPCCPSQYAISSTQLFNSKPLTEGWGSSGANKKAKLN